MEQVKTLTVAEASKILGLTPLAVREMMKNGSLPIGSFINADKQNNKRTSVYIVKKRLEAWVNAEDLKCEGSV